MHLLDPARPKFGHFRGYIFNDRVIGPMPQPQIFPLDNGNYLVQFLLLVDSSTGRYFSIETSDVNAILTTFCNHPEEFFTSCLKYQPPALSGKVKKKNPMEDEIFNSILKDLKI